MPAVKVRGEEVPAETEGIPELEPTELMRSVLYTLACRVRDPKRYRGRLVALWSEVGALTAHGSGYSHRICRRFGYDPDLRIKPFE